MDSEKNEIMNKENEENREPFLKRSPSGRRATIGLQMHLYPTNPAGHVSAPPAAEGNEYSFEATSTTSGKRRASVAGSMFPNGISPTRSKYF